MALQKDTRTQSSKYRRESNPRLSTLVEAIERKHDTIKKPKALTMRGHQLVVDPGVFNPEYSMMGELLAVNIHIPSGASVLDLGTGTGFQAIVASDRADRIVAVDKQWEAVECARKNVALNRLEAKIQVRHGDLFSALRADELFHVILFNIPFPPWQPKTPWQEANFDQDHRLLSRFIKGARSHLQLGGRIGMTWSDIGDTDYFHQLLRADHYSYRILVERKVGEVGQYVYELTL